jgi:hypothetical protein
VPSALSDLTGGSAYNGDIDSAYDPKRARLRKKFIKYVQKSELEHGESILSNFAVRLGNEATHPNEDNDDELLSLSDFEYWHGSGKLAWEDSTLLTNISDADVVSTPEAEAALVTERSTMIICIGRQRALDVLSPFGIDFDNIEGISNLSPEAATYTRQRVAKDRWDDFRELLSTRGLTNPVDRLPAISAIAKQFVSVFGEDRNYIAGHWVPHLPRDLVWSSDGRRDRHEAFPTWSWASVNTTQNTSKWIQFETYDWYYVIREVATLLEVDVSLKHPTDSFGDVHSAKLLLAALLLPVDLTVLEWQPDDYSSSRPVPLEALAPSIRPDYLSTKLDTFYREMGKEMFEAESKGEYFLLEILRFDDRKKTFPAIQSLGLVVRCVTEARDATVPQYIRVGVFRCTSPEMREKRKAIQRLKMVTIMRKSNMIRTLTMIIMKRTKRTRRTRRSLISYRWTIMKRRKYG